MFPNKPIGIIWWGADLAVQLRRRRLGILSGALLDCAAAGLPTVTNESLAASVGAPHYIRCNWKSA
jgi:hypothetical protein